MKHFFFSALAAVFSLHVAMAQDSITIKDAEELKYRSEALIKREFRDLLNNIANTDIDLAETKKVIFNSHSGTRNRIFLSPKVLLEDDINPGFHTSANTRDIEVEKYLNDFDLLYKKSDASSVSFNEVKSTNIKKGKFLFLKVYFTSFFRNANKTNDTAYVLNNRVAEIRIERDKNKWTPFIARIGFFNPADTANDVSDDVQLMREKGATGPALTTTDSASVVHAQLNFEAQLKENARKEAIDADQKEGQSFNDLISKGDKALDGNDFTGALKFYKEAQDMRPYDPLAKSKINGTNKARERATITADQLYDQYLHKAVLAENKREYQAAIGFYNDAITQKPDQAAKYDAKKRELTDKFRITSELDEKYKAGLYKEAIKEYDAAIKKNKTNSDLYLGRAKCYEKITEPAKAMKDYTQSYELDRSNLETIQKRAALYRSTGDYFKSLTDYKTYLTINKENIDIYAEMSDLRMLINKNTEDAIKDLNDGLAVDPKASLLYLKKGLLLLEKNDYRGADNNFSSTIQLDSNNALAYYNRGKSQLLLNNPVTAGVDFDAAREKGLDAVNLKNIESYAAAYFQRSTTKFANLQKDSAIKLADYAIAVNSLSSVYRFTRGEYYFAVNNYKEAINNYDQALAIDKNYIDAFYRRGLAFYNLGNYKAAIDNYTSAVKLNPQLYLGQKGLGDAYLALADYPNASSNYEGFIQTIDKVKLPPNPSVVAEAYNGMGKAYFAAGNYEKALAAFKNAVKKNAALPEALYYRGYTLYKTNELSDAISDMSKAVSMENTHYQWHFNLGKAYQDKKDFQNAAICYNNCIKLDTTGKMPEAFYLRGYSNYELQNYPAALTDYAKVYPTVQNNPAIPINTEMGNIYLNMNKYDSAFDYYNRSYLKDSAGNGAAMYGIGSVFYLRGKPDDALVWFEKSFQTKKVNISDIKKDKLIAALRDDKRFKALIKKYY